MGEQQRIGNVMRTYHGRDFWPLDPRANEVHVGDIAAALAKLCRFGGHCNEFYSVAEHSVFVAQLVERTHPDLALHALLHDAAEAYLGDTIAPLKDAVLVLRVGIDEPARKTEFRILEAIRVAVGLRLLTPDEAKVIEHADAVALATEARDLMGDPKWPGLPAPVAERLVPVSWGAAKRAHRRWPVGEQHKRAKPGSRTPASSAGRRRCKVCDARRVHITVEPTP